ncbi:MAG: bifunctional 5,10-methylene-tetrahydrofolate dehydrogenase/5,10-methylene-tetrahydrofolate [Candidatus Saccharibacteria bacterium]|nr:bifunctional 5,10-methylene-tetrahydrofolate dehydrogenase/5,10-methylene-tetrahydrofolate [Candidatus Saccharibacteria bacterium]
MGGELTSYPIVPAFEDDIRERAACLRDHGVVPTLAVIRNNRGEGGSDKYFEKKVGLAKDLGLMVLAVSVFDGDELAPYVEVYNDNPRVHGILTEHPSTSTPEDDAAVRRVINRYKDVDGSAKDSYFPANTPSAICRFLKGNGIDYEGSRVGIFGRGRVGGRLTTLMKNQGARVSTIDKGASEQRVRRALAGCRIIVSAAGAHNDTLTEARLKHVSTEGLVVVDVGWSTHNDKLVPDVPDCVREAVIEGGGFVSAKFGSVGPLATRGVMKNVVTAAERIAMRSAA